MHKFFVYIFYIAPLFLIFYLILYPKDLSEIKTLSKEFELETRNEYLEKYQGGVPIYDIEELTYRSKPELVTNGKLNNCAIYNVCPEGNEISRTIIRKIWLPDKSAFVTCSSKSKKILGVWDSDMDTEYETKLPGTFLYDYWDPVNKCRGGLGVKQLKHYIFHTKALLVVYKTCTKPEKINSGVPYNQSDDKDIENWHNCIRTNIGKWLLENPYIPPKISYPDFKYQKYLELADSPLPFKDWLKREYDHNIYFTNPLL